MQRAYLFCDRNLVHLNAAMLQLYRVWDKYSHLLMVDLPISAAELAGEPDRWSVAAPTDAYASEPTSAFAYPFTIQEFESMQRKRVLFVRDALTERWLSDVAGIFRAYVDENEVNGETERVCVLDGVRVLCFVLGAEVK